MAVQWATKVLRAVDIVPPGAGVGGMHQLNVESTVHGVCSTDNSWLYPDSVLGTDSHTAICNGLGVLSIRELWQLFVTMYTVLMCFFVRPFPYLVFFSDDAMVGAFLQLGPFCSWGLSAGYQPRPQVVDRGTTARYGGQLRYIYK